MSPALSGAWRRVFAFVAVALLAAYPMLPGVDAALDRALGLPLQLDRQLLGAFIFGLLSLGLYVQLGLAGLMQLGSAAFFALGAYTAGVLTVQKFPFQLGFWPLLLLAPAVGGVGGVALGGLCARVNGDQLAMVTLGFGEVVRVVLLNLESITDGSRGLNPLPAPALPGWAVALLGGPQNERVTFLPVYWTALACLVAVYVGLGALGRAPLGRALRAMREDALAARSLGLSLPELKCVAMGLGGAVSSLAGALYATYLTTTAEPNTYDAGLSYMVLCGVILGGVHHRVGAVLGASLLVAFDNVLTPTMGQLFAHFAGESALATTLGNFANWRWAVFGTALIATMRLRPEGLVSGMLAGARPRAPRGRAGT